MGPFLAAALPVLANIAGNLVGAGAQSRHNMKLARYQNEYNSPANQMKRYREAGLNPNLIYSQGNSGNMSPISPTNYQAALSNVGTQYTQSELAQTQSDVGQQKIDESKQKTELLKTQDLLLKQNPYMNPEYVKALVGTAMSNAAIIEQKQGFLESKTQDDVTGARWERGYLIMQRELDNMTQKFHLANADLKLKAEVFESIDFKNWFLGIQKTFMDSGEWQKGHIWEFIKLVMIQMMKM